MTLHPIEAQLRLAEIQSKSNTMKNREIKQWIIDEKIRRTLTKLGHVNYLTHLTAAERRRKYSEVALTIDRLVKKSLSWSIGSLKAWIIFLHAHIQILDHLASAFKAFRAWDRDRTLLYMRPIIAVSMKSLEIRELMPSIFPAGRKVSYCGGKIARLQGIVEEMKRVMRDIDRHLWLKVPGPGILLLKPADYRRLKIEDWENLFSKIPQSPVRKEFGATDLRCDEEGTHAEGYHSIVWHLNFMSDETFEHHGIFLEAMNVHPEALKKAVATQLESAIDKQDHRKGVSQRTKSVKPRGGTTALVWTNEDDKRQKAVLDEEISTLKTALTKSMEANVSLTDRCGKLEAEVTTEKSRDADKFAALEAKLADTSLTLQTAKSTIEARDGEHKLLTARNLSQESRIASATDAIRELGNRERSSNLTMDEQRKDIQKKDTQIIELTKQLESAQLNAKPEENLEHLVTAQPLVDIGEKVRRRLREQHVRPRMEQDSSIILLGDRSAHYGAAAADSLWLEDTAQNRSWCIAHYGISYDYLKSFSGSPTFMKIVDCHFDMVEVGPFTTNAKRFQTQFAAVMKDVEGLVAEFGQHLKADKLESFLLEDAPASRTYLVEALIEGAKTAFHEYRKLREEVKDEERTTIGTKGGNGLFGRMQRKKVEMRSKVAGMFGHVEEDLGKK